MFFTDILPHVSLKVNYRYNYVIIVKKYTLKVEKSLDKAISK